MGEENNDKQPDINVDEVLDKQSKATRSRFAKGDKKHYMDLNMSWVMLIVMGLATFGIAYALQRETTFLAGYVILYVLIGYAYALVFYNLGKLICGAAKGYKVSRVEILGMQFIRTGKKTIFSFTLGNIFELHMNLTPKDNQPHNPTLMFWGGTIFYLIGAIAAFGVSFIPSLSVNATTTIRFATAIGALLVFYEIFPCKLDVPNDMYWFLVTRNKEDRDAYNKFLLDEYDDLVGNIPTAKVFTHYKNSRTQPLTLLAVLHSQVYAGDYTNALKTITSMETYDVVLSDRMRVEALYEQVYLYLTHGRTSESEKLIMDLQSQVKKTSDYHPSLSALRSDVLISGLLDNSLEAVQDSLAAFAKAAVVFGADNLRVIKETSLVNAAITRIKTAHPDWKIEPVSLEKIDKEVKAKEKKTDSPDEY